MSKNMVILSVSVGEGHNQVSRALKEEWEERGYEAVIIDVFSLINITAAKHFKSAYFFCIKCFPRFWDGIYRLTNLYSVSHIIRPVLKLWWRKQGDLLKDNNCHLIVATHPLATQVAILLQEQVNKKIPLFSVVTDFSTHQLSVSKHVTGVFLTEEGEAEKLKAQHPHCNFYPYGIPVRKVWHREVKKEELRKKLGIHSALPIIVVAGGGEGLIAEREIIKILEQESEPCNVFWFKGKRGTHKSEIVKLINGTIINNKSFSSDYVNYVMAADLIISKPGGVSMAEAVYLNIPVGMLSPLPGQEKINQAILEDYPNIYSVNDTTSVTELIKRANKERTEDLTLPICSRKKVVDMLLSESELVEWNKTAMQREKHVPSSAERSQTQYNHEG